MSSAAGQGSLPAAVMQRARSPSHVLLKGRFSVPPSELVFIIGVKSKRGRLRNTLTALRRQPGEQRTVERSTWMNSFLPQEHRPVSVDEEVPSPEEEEAPPRRRSTREVMPSRSFLIAEK